MACFLRSHRTHSRVAGWLRQQPAQTNFCMTALAACPILRTCCEAVVVRNVENFLGQSWGLPNSTTCHLLWIVMFLYCCPLCLFRQHNQFCCTATGVLGNEMIMEWFVCMPSFKRDVGKAGRLINSCTRLHHKVDSVKGQLEGMRSVIDMRSQVPVLHCSASRSILYASHHTDICYSLNAVMQAQKPLFTGAEVVQDGAPRLQKPNSQPLDRPPPVPHDLL